MRLRPPVVTAAAFAVALAPAAAQPPPAGEVKVQVQRRGERLVVDVEARVAVPAQLAWEVLTDYDHMARFVSSLSHSAILRRDGNVLEVEQRGETRVGPLRFSRASVRRVELLPPREIRATLVSGDFKSFSYTTRVAAGADGTLQITNHGEYVPTTWLPPVIGPNVIAGETRRSWEQLVAEMRRRATAAPR